MAGPATQRWTIRETVMPFRQRYTGLIEKYRDRLPLPDDSRVIGLGATPPPRPPPTPRARASPPS